MNQIVLDLMPASLLQVVQGWQRRFLQSAAAVFFQDLAIGNNPRLHAGRHKQYLLVAGAVRLLPFRHRRDLPKVIPSILGVRHRILAVEPHSEVGVMLILVRGNEIIKNRCATSTGHESGHPRLEP